MINEIGTSASTSAQQTRTASGSKLGKDEFLKMLVAQMRNQDPLNPQDGQQMAAQLAQFSSLEQLTNMSEGLAGLTEVLGGQMMHTLNASNALGVLGRTVLAASDQVQIGGTEPSTVTVELAGRGVSGTLRIYDANGRQVGSRELGVLPAGRQTLDVGKAAEGLPAGVYTYEVDVVDGSGKAVEATTFVRATVDGVRNGASGPILTAGGITLPFGAIVEIGTK